MSIKNSKLILVSAVLCGMWGVARVSTLHAKPGDPGRMLSFGSSGRDVGLGGAVTAVPQGVNSVYWNPALLSGVSRKDVSFLQAQLFSQTSLNWMGYAHPFKKRSGTIAFQVIQLKTGSGDKRDENNEVTGSFGQSDQVVGFGYGFRPTSNERLSLGLGFNVMQRTLDKAANSLYGLNLGAHYQAGRKLTSGLVFQNVLRGKSGDTEDALPLSMRVGNVYEILNGFNVTGDLVLNNFNQMAFNVGTELSWKFMNFRAGRPSDGDFSFGVGLYWKSFRLDVAMSSHKDLGASQLFSFGAAFGKDRNVTRKVLSEDYMRKAVERYSKGEWVQSKEWLDRALKSDMSGETVQLQSERLNGTLKALGLPARKKQSVADQEKFQGSGEARRLVQEGVRSFIQGIDSDALLLLRQARAHRPQDKKLQDFVAYVEKVVGAKAEVQSDMGPDEIVTLKLKKVEDFFDAGQLQEALKVCMELVKVAPDMALPRVRLGSVYYAMGDVLNARKEYEKALKMDPSDRALREFMKMQGWVK